MLLTISRIGHQPWRRLQQHASKTGENLVFYVHAGNTEAITPYDATITTTEEDVYCWCTIYIPWVSFNRVPWADASRLQSFDPTLVMSYGINIIWRRRPAGGLHMDG